MRVLVVDDHEMFAQSVKHLLGTSYKVSAVTSGTEALKTLSDQRCDVVLLDHNLPDVDGLTILKVIQALPTPPPVIMLSGNDSANLLQEAKRLGAAGFLHKSLPAEELLSAVRRVASGQSYGIDDSFKSTDSFQTNDIIDTRKFNAVVIDELGITQRQLDVLLLLMQGDANKTIARKLGIADSTVKTHVKTLFQVLKVNNRVACCNRVTELGLLVEPTL